MSGALGVQSVDGGDPGPIWEGVYQCFTDVPRVGTGFAGDEWAAALEARLSAALGRERTALAANLPSYSSTVLPVVAAVLGEAHRPLRVLDFGGGAGETFLAVASALPTTPLDYHVVDVARVCALAERSFATDGRVRFHTALPPSVEKFDLVHLGSSLQYIEDWKGMLRQLTTYEPAMCLLTELPAGDIPTYATAQNYYGSKIATWFFNRGEVVDCLREFGYRLVFRSRFEGTYLGLHQPCPQDNFPAKLRLGYACNLLFSRTLG